MIDWTAAELAGALSGLSFTPHNTARASMLDEATAAFGLLSPEFRRLTRAFEDARHRHGMSYSAETKTYSDDDWAAVLTAASRLARQLSMLGDFRIPRCKRRSVYGVCNSPLGADGTCGSAREHLDDPAVPGE